jgi:predicted GNAT family acetyltransferase
MTTTVEAEAISRQESNSGLIDVLTTTTPREVESDFELDVINDAERGRWIVALGADAIGELTYRFVGGRVVLLSTWVNQPYRNRRGATELIARELDEIRGTGKKITIICPVVGEFIARNPQYLDLIDDAHPGSGAYPQPGPATARDDEHQLGTFEHDLT